jgi:outer membrane lipopolysaccharide assembly protein LptE/RlpB
MFMLRTILYSIFGLVIGFLSGCGAYSFTGASIPPDVETISIDKFENVASGGPPALSQTFTESLKDRFVDQTRLTLVDRNGDLQLSGNIVKYEVSHAATTGKQQTALNRLTIAVQAQFKNTKNSEENWEQRFSQFADYESNQNLSEVEDQLVREINEQLITDIFNKAVVNW